MGSIPHYLCIGFCMDIFWIVNKMKLEFGNPEHIKLKKRVERKLSFAEYKKKLKVKCPTCKQSLEVCDVDIERKYILWAGCTNTKCVECILHDDHDLQYHWDGSTDLKGKYLD